MAVDHDVRRLAPEAFDAFETVMVSARAAIDADLWARSRRCIATRLRVDDPVELPDVDPTPGTDRDRTALAFTEQFVIDVSQIDDAQRHALGEALGDQAPAFAQALYALDYELRLRSVFGAVLGRDPFRVWPTHEPAELWPALENMLTAIARLAALDPLTTEIVRLRGARVHNCRICQSLRNVQAVEAVGGDTEFEQVDRYEQSDLPERHKVALRLADALYWSPGTVPAGLAEQARQHFTDEEITEILLDVARNALNKFAVSMGTDGEGVGDGLSFYDVDTATGELVYGLIPGGSGA